VNSTDAVGSGKRNRSEGAETGHFVRDQGLKNYPGCLMAVSITLASVDDAMAARSVILQIDRAAQPRLKVIWADNKYHNLSLNEHVQTHPLVDWKI
jgi:hypothetical protein